MNNADQRRKRDADPGWIGYAGGMCLGIYDMSPDPLPAGAARQGTVNITEPGTYRVVIGTDRGPVRSGAITIE